MTLQIISAIVISFTTGAYVGMAVADSENKKAKKLDELSKFFDIQGSIDLFNGKNPKYPETSFSQKKKTEEKRLEDIAIGKKLPFVTIKKVAKVKKVK